MYYATVALNNFSTNMLLSGDFNTGTPKSTGGGGSGRKNETLPAPGQRGQVPTTKKPPKNTTPYLKLSSEGRETLINAK